MVKEIELLLPLLGQATWGAIWLVSALLLKDMLLWGGLIVAVFLSFRKTMTLCHQREMRGSGDLTPVEIVYFAAQRGWFKSGRNSDDENLLWPIYSKLSEEMTRRGLKKD